MNGLTSACVGCGRTLREIAAWTRFTDAERDAIMAALPDRLARAAAAEQAPRGSMPA